MVWKLYINKAVKTNKHATDVPALSMEDVFGVDSCLVWLGPWTDPALGFPQT